VNIFTQQNYSNLMNKSKENQTFFEFKPKVDSI